MSFHPEKPETKARNTERRKVEREARRTDLIARLTEAYLTHPDREYAEEFYGDMLREQGVDPSTLEVK